jgi:hypothetical protein
MTPNAEYVGRYCCTSDDDCWCEMGDLYWERLAQWEQNEAAEPLPPNDRSGTP